MRTARSTENLELNQDLEFQRRYWQFQQVGRGLLLVLLIAAAVGLLGGGPFSGHSVGNSSIRIEYARFVRRQARTVIRAGIAAAASRSRPPRLWIARSYLDDVSLQDITPQPASVELTPDRVIYEFRVAETSGVLWLTLALEPQRYGRRTASMGLENSPGVHFSQFVFP